jgi:hypothetical protein
VQSYSTGKKMGGVNNKTIGKVRGGKRSSCTGRLLKAVTESHILEPGKIRMAQI